MKNIEESPPNILVIFTDQQPLIVEAPFYPWGNEPGIRKGETGEIEGAGTRSAEPP